MWVRQKEGKNIDIYLGKRDKENEMQHRGEENARDRHINIKRERQKDREGGIL